MPDLDPFAGLRSRLRGYTPARVAIGHVGHAVPTAATLDFQMAHAQARDAVHAPLAPGILGESLAGHAIVEVQSAAPDRATYLMRPDLGRRLPEAEWERLGAYETQLAIVVADGLSATAVVAHGQRMADALVQRATGWTIGPIVVAHQARVALGDEIALALKAELVVVMIGERPGLSAADGLGAYITYRPRLGHMDSERNCVSNIRPPLGWSIEAAADEILRIAERARLLGRTGVGIEFDSLGSVDT
jgi:ethanolamine ammonia-lyase small subunit